MKQVRVSKTSEPAKVASSLLYILEGGDNVEVMALGLSSAILIKACALVNNLNNGRLDLLYIPSMEYVKDGFGETRSAVKMSISLKRK